MSDERRAAERARQDLINGVSTHQEDKPLVEVVSEESDAPEASPEAAGDPVLEDLEPEADVDDMDEDDMT